MSDSTISFDAISQAQASKEVTANAYFDAASPATLFGRRQSTTSGLTWGYYGGWIQIDGVRTKINNGTIVLPASTTNIYIICTRAGVVGTAITSTTPGDIILYKVTTGPSTVTSYTDERTWVSLPGVYGRLNFAMTDANTTLGGAQAKNDILEFTGALTLQRNIVVPLGAQQWTVFNNTTGGFGLQFIGATGTGVVVAAGKRAIIYADGTNVVRVTADT